jgi:putative oxidoreductase
MILDSRRTYTDLGLLVIRVGIGLGMFYFQGLPKLMGGAAGLETVGSAMGHLGITFGYYYWGLLAAIAEGLGGLLLAAGLIFRPAAAAMAFVMLMAFIEQLSRPMPVPVHPFNNFWVFVGLFIAGPGRHSLDRLLFGNKDHAGLEHSSPAPSVR